MNTDTNVNRHVSPRYHQQGVIWHAGLKAVRCSPQVERNDADETHVQPRDRELPRPPSSQRALGVPLRASHGVSHP